MVAWLIAEPGASLQMELAPGRLFALGCRRQVAVEMVSMLVQRLRAVFVAAPFEREPREAAPVGSVFATEQQLQIAMILATRIAAVERQKAVAAAFVLQRRRVRLATWGLR